MKKIFSVLPWLWMTSSAYAQTSGWEKPITTYATNVLGGIQTAVSIIGGVVVIALLGWGFFTKNPGMYKWALGGMAIIVLAQIGPGMINALSAIG